MQRFLDSLKAQLGKFGSFYLGLNPLLQQLLIFCAVVIVFSIAFSVFAILPRMAFIVAMQVLMGGFVILVLYVAYRMFREG